MRVPLAALVFAAASISLTAHAATISGSVWNSSSWTPGTVPASAPASTPLATFSVTGPSTIFAFDSYGNTSNTGNYTTDYTLTTWLQSLGDTVSYTTGGNEPNIDDYLFDFTGNASLTAGTTYTFIHDDGMILYLSGNGLTNDAVINSPGPTAPKMETFTVATSGIYSFNLLYAEDTEAAELYSPNFAITPEPTSIVMLGSGLLAGAGLIRRRIKG